MVVGMVVVVVLIVIRLVFGFVFGYGLFDAVGCVAGGVCCVYRYAM